jgi:hypothetical protein
VCFQYQRKSSRCHREPRVWLHDQEGLLPGTNQPGQQDEKDAIGFRACRPFHLPLEDDQRHAQEGMFGEKLGLASAEVGGVASGKEVRSGLVHRAKREERACKQPSKSHWREVKTRPIQEASPSHEKSVVRAGDVGDDFGWYANLPLFASRENRSFSVSQG